ncbi:Uncharacterised protein [Bordetella pertussis]|nr:Uncharacterised protein [Bordetella pertussis]CPM21147.1 Uncharacterised protein [Bordetella pertussis]
MVSRMSSLVSVIGPVLSSPRPRRLLTFMRPTRDRSYVSSL